MNNTAATALLTATQTSTLVLSALTLDAKATLTNEERIVKAWTCDEIENRMGGVQDGAAFDALLDAGLSYIEALLVTFPEVAA